MIKKAILFKEQSFPLISFLTTGYWMGEETLTYYDDEGRLAQGDLVGKLVLAEKCIPLILEELHTGIYDTDFMYVEVTQSNFNRKMETSGLKNWVGWTTKHKKFELIVPETYTWIKKLKT
jgi:hypothetical protein